ncbi:MAG: hypothetical protein PUK70_06415 [Bacteroidales bacterium]|nr:hypothetical protein [Bacteroidales bacterium]MDY6001297.1 hypothetical protein [Candidatus Cryptobacteroides sp.]
MDTNKGKRIRLRFMAFLFGLKIVSNNTAIGTSMVLWKKKEITIITAPSNSDMVLYRVGLTIREYPKKSIDIPKLAR